MTIRVPKHTCSSVKWLSNDDKSIPRHTYWSAVHAFGIRLRELLCVYLNNKISHKVFKSKVCSISRPEKVTWMARASEMTFCHGIGSVLDHKHTTRGRFLLVSSWVRFGVDMWRLADQVSQLHVVDYGCRQPPQMYFNPCYRNTVSVLQGVASTLSC